ncbi:DUF3105 domain-containing protein [Actinomycetes bacterium KLBMP 9797]
MSISTPAGDNRRPSVVSTGKKPSAGKPPAAKTTPAKASAKGGGSGKGAPAGKGGGGKGPRKPVPQVKVKQPRNWGPIGLFVAVGVLAAAIIGYGAWAAFQGSKPWEERADAIDGIVNFRERSDAKQVLTASHVQGAVNYPMNPPVGGNHNQDWQNCVGDVYTAPIAKEHAVHSLEHGAVWITYKTGLAADQVEKLASKVRGNEFMMMSPVNDLDRNISLQAWGYQLKLDNADDGRIDDFISALRRNSSLEPEAGCSGGITATGDAPRNLQQQQQGTAGS